MEDNFDPDKYLAETPDIEEAFDPDAYLSESKKETSSEMSADSILTPTGGFLSQATSGISKLPEKFLKAGEFAAQKVGGLTPEQVDYYKQNYKAMEASGMTPEAIQETFGELEKTFKQKNLAATMALEQAEKLAPTKLTKKVAQQAVAEALPELLSPIPVKEQPFQEKLKQTISERKSSDLQRLESLLLQKDEALIKAREYAQQQAELAGEKAAAEARKANKKIGLANVKLDEKAVYNEAFDKAINESKIKEEELISKLQSEKSDLIKKGIESQLKDISPGVTKELVEQYQTPLAKTYPELKGRESKISINQKAIDKMLEDLSDVTSKEGREAFDFLRELSKKGWDKESGISDEFAAKVREKLRGILSPENTLSDKEFKKVSKLLNELSAAESAGFIERTTGEINPKTIEEKISKFSPESVKIGQSEQQFIKKVMNPSAKDLQNVDIQEARLLLTKLVDDPALLDRVKQAAIKMDILDPTKSMKFGATDAFRFLVGAGLGQMLPLVGYEGIKALKTPTGAYKAATAGARIAEAIPQSLKTLGKGIGQALPFAGAAAGAYYGYQEAKEEGLPEAAAIPYAAFEAVSPVPISPIQAKKALEASAVERAKNIEQNLKMSPEELEKAKQRSESIKSFLPDWMTKKKEEVKFSSTNPEDISKLSESLLTSEDKAAQEYARVLNQITGSSEQQKQAVLYSLNQQPAFRELVRKIKGQ